MTIQKLILSCAGLLLVVASGSASAAGDEQQLKEKLGHLQSWSASFDQTVKDGGGEILQEVSGQLKLRQPSQFTWETQDPFPQLIVSDGDQLWIFDQDLEQVVIRDMGPELSAMPASILSGQFDQLGQHFKVTLKETKDGDQFTLIPQEESQDFDELRLHFDQDTLESLHLKDTLGQTTALRFHESTLNPNFKDAHFTFEVPKGIDVIDERARAL